MHRPPTLYPIIAVLAGVLSHGCSPTSPAGKGGDRATTPPGRLGEALGWLPADTESVLVCRGPFECEGLDPEADSVPAPQPRYADPPDVKKDQEPVVPRRRVTAAPVWLLKYLRTFAIGPLVDPSAPGPANPLGGRTVSFTLEGSRRFRSSGNLGMMPYDGAHIVVFRENLGPAGLAFMDRVKKAADKTEVIDGQVTADLNWWDGTERKAVYVTHPKPDVIVWATARGCLQEVLGRMAHGGEGRALPPNLPEWEHVDPSAAFWAVRHYDRKYAPEDPSSPLAGRRAEANVPDDRAVGLTLAFGPGDGILRAVYLSGHKDALEIGQGMWMGLGKSEITPDVRPNSPGTVRTSVPLIGMTLGGEPGSVHVLLLLLQALGHSVSF